MNIVAIVQARMGSTRLPGKVLLDLSGKPILERCMDRLQLARTLDEVVIATTIDPADDAIVDQCDKHGWSCSRGSEQDVLDRYYRAAVAHKADIVARITSDCPLIEPKVVDRVVREFQEIQPAIDYACNTLPMRTFPRGLDTEVFRFDVLERAWHQDHDPASREHVTPYVWRNPEVFHIHGIMNDVDYSHMRWTVDTEEDLAFVRRIYEHFGYDHFSWRDVLGVLKANPEWLEINRSVRQKEI
ncbi:cytidylyltransferase domain-containing protein [Candidatus Bipolaricaulota bacterium]